jgi:hypothetical protein
MKQDKSIKIFTLALVMVIYMIAPVTMGDVYVEGYYRNDGTYVEPHWRSDPDGDISNNWSTYPNVNPHTNQIGTKRYKNYPYIESQYVSKDYSSLLNTLLFCALIAIYSFSNTEKNQDSPKPDIK